ncbi:MAG: hypothetical protein CMQ36_09150 [Gammaproteobacteria bacterium]|nr:hypothetical protein [Gammaproteobacteria bacterium]HAO54734.1 hypothetical protein [Gammaproteobacteria bacterium]|tara:strand:- start:1452 stop:2159 length:708 start_codon:yes stop_codon:yes gene_type:complete
MCGRFNVSEDPVAKFFMDFAGLEFTGVENFNTAPTESTPIIRSDSDDRLAAVMSQWWLVPRWSREPKTRFQTFNARSETVAKARSFKQCFEQRRCIVPITGYYEWKNNNGVKVPYYVKPSDGSTLVVAGLWDRWVGTLPDKSSLESFTILTTSASAGLDFLHARQPVMLADQEAHEWLDLKERPSDMGRFFTGHRPKTLSVTPVSTYVGNSRHKNPTCMEAVGASIEIESAVLMG